MKKKLFLPFAVIVLLTISCSTDKQNQSNRVVVGIAADVESLNPLYAFTFDEGNITELLYLSLVKHNWDDEEGYINSSLMLAENLEWNGDSTELKVTIRDDVNWSDGKPCTVDDVVFSFDAYSDPLVQSRALGFFENYYLDELGKIDLRKSFEKVSDYELLIHFPKSSTPGYFDIDHPIIPKHGFSGLTREDYETARFNRKPITNGPYKLKSWQPNQQLILKADSSSFLITPESVKEIAFRIVPEYNNRVLQLQNGEIDLMEEVKTEDAERLKLIDDISIDLVKGREYDYIGWNNLDPAAFTENEEIKPHPIFGDKNIRIALTHALNRKAVLENYLLNYGELATGPISSIFKKAFNENVMPYEYNPELAKEMLNKAGWVDSDNDGILDKDGKKFLIKLLVPSGNPRRKYAATVFQNNLKEIGITLNVQFMEMGTFIDGLFEKKFDAWMVGWLTPIPINLNIQWNSDLNASPVNFASFQNEEVDGLLKRIQKNIRKEEFYSIHKRLHKLIHENEPVSFLYWIDNIVAYNSRIKNVDVNPLGVIHNCWQWSVN